ncbi:Superoxide dismutase [Mn] [Emticicia aquatica]|uniref:Superoxide dismutase n=1 Tax=Emticicia aquatica TaxID=1681835 RepID=A0ABN8EQD4_9BACT|nr:superoxide dismutase [Emticicia aquatica]CAH0994055.1 Superoxide dismutase [Mn] [Emticicia aquatica]
MNRKDFIKAFIGSAFAFKLSDTFASKAPFFEGMHTLAPLPYANDALEPHIDKLTMEIHHDRHHKAYVDNLNKVIAGTDMEKLSIDQLLKDISKYPTAVRNNGGGHWNHTFFWQIMGPNAGGVPSGKLAEAITATFGSFDNLKTEFTKAATTRFGSGWAWLMVTPDKKLKIVSTANQDNPLMDIAADKGTPVLALDVWEHAYYLKYQNKRADYVAAFWNVVNWSKVNENFEAAMK